MREVKYYNNTEGMYQAQHYCDRKSLGYLVRNWQLQVREDCLFRNADHYIYETIEYDKK